MADSQGTSRKSICVFTSLMGDYEQLNDQADCVREDVDFFCFSSTDLEPSDTWNIIRTDPEYPADMPRSQRHIKLIQHPIVAMYDYTIYIDNSVLLKSSPQKLVSDTLCEGKYDLAIGEHSYRNSVLEEFKAVSDLAYDEQAVILGQLRAYAAFPEILSQKPYWGGMIIRRNGVPAVERMMRVWMDQILLYSRRDQLSANMAVSKSGVKVNSLKFNNNLSPYHSWPHVTGRQNKMSLSDMAREISDAAAVSTLIKNLMSNSEVPDRLADSETNMTLPCQNLDLQAGSNRAGAGGQLSFGVAEFPSFSPMAAIGGCLENAVGKENQGALSFKTRSVGEAGQSLHERFRINHDGVISLFPTDAGNPAGGCSIVFDNQKGLLVSLDGKTWQSFLTQPVALSFSELTNEDKEDDQ